MVNLYCLFLGGGIAYIYDRSDMTGEYIRASALKEYVRSDIRKYDVTGIQYRNCSLDYSPVKVPVGVYNGDSYIAELCGVSSNIAWLYRDDMRYRLDFDFRYNAGTRCYLLELSCSGTVLYREGAVSTKVWNSFVPLKDGLYLMVDGEIKYKVGYIPAELGEPYRASKKRVEVLLSV